MKRIAACILLLGITGCVLKTGDASEMTDKLFRTSGPTVGFTFNKERMSGELLGFRADSAFVLANREIYAVPNRALVMSGRTVDWYQTPPASALQTEARYPSGMTVELERNLLAKLGQSATRR